MTGKETKSKESIRGEGRQRLIHAAAECYRRSGGDAMKINEVCAEADVSIGTIYHHFPGGIPDLEGLLYIETLDAYQQGLLSELKSHRSASAGVKGAVLYHLDWMASNLALASFLSSFRASWLSDEHQLQLDDMNLDFVRISDEWREPFVRAGQLRSIESPHFGWLVLGPADRAGSDIIAQFPAEVAASVIRRVGETLAEGAWLAVKGEET
jgi:AcrR family transcriptional regulator